MRDFDERPYSADELRVATWFSEKGTGGGDDPIGAMIASHEYAVAQRNDYYERCEQWAKGNLKREQEACRLAVGLAGLPEWLAHMDASFQSLAHAPEVSEHLANMKRWREAVTACVSDADAGGAR